MSPIEDFSDDSDEILMARLIWGEARGESVRGKLAVALTVIHRVAKPSWWGSTIREVILKPVQYSCFNENNINYKPMLDPVIHSSARLWQDCVECAILVIKGEVNDLIGGSTHYHAVGTTPSWAIDRQPFIRIGKHVFYPGVE